MNEIKYIKKYVEKLYLKNDPSHDFEHIMRVYKNAEKICNTENVNKKLGSTLTGIDYMSSSLEKSYLIDGHIIEVNQFPILLLDTV